MRQGEFFMIEYKEEKNRIFFMGSELVSFCVKYPEVEGREKINSLLYEFASSSISWATGDLFTFAQEQYQNSAQNSERFAHKPYRYTLNILADDEGADMHVKISAVLCRGRDEIKRYDEELVFDTDAEIIRKPKKSGISR